MLTLKGKNVVLRALEPEDLDFVFEVENDEGNWELGSTQTPFSRFVIREYLKNAHKDIYEVKQLRLMITDDKNRPLGLIDLYDFNPKHKRAGIGILIADPEDRDKGIGSKALQLLCKYAFVHLELHQLFAHIQKDNTASIHLFEKHGFVQTGVKKDWNRYKGTYQDELLFQKVNE